MGTGNIAGIIDGITGLADQLNQYREALIGAYVPRDSAGNPLDEGAGIGTTLYRWAPSYIKDIERNPTILTSGTADLDLGQDALLKSNASLVADASSNNYVTDDTLVFTLTSGAYITLFFSCEGMTATSYQDFAHLLMVPSTSPYSGALASTMWDNASAQVTNQRSRANFYLESLIHTQTGSSYPGQVFANSPVRLSGTFYFAAGTHTVELIHGMNNFGTSGNFVTYTNCFYGVRRAV